MRDLGLMGESTFSLWCGEAGLIPNGSRIDKTGWDFYVEFPFPEEMSALNLHRAAFECKVQVKATDRKDKKISVSLSNLRRLITAQMPAFFVFMEFDGEAVAKQAYLLHIDNELITKILKRLHELDQSNKDNRLNKRTMTLTYGDDHRLSPLGGKSLKRKVLGFVGEDLEEYISNKRAHLQSTGFEDGFGQITFTTEGEENLRRLVDVSLGIEGEVDISRFKGLDRRFGIAAKTPFVDCEGGKLQMPNLQPTAKGMVRFKEDKLAPGLSFDANLYISPFNAMVPDKFKKIRVEGEFFEFIFNPYTGSANYSFSFGEGFRLELRRFRDALKLVHLMGLSGKRLHAELQFDGFPPLAFAVGGKGREFDFSLELKAMEAAVKIWSYFEISDDIDVSLGEIGDYEAEIVQLSEIISSPPDLLRIQFRVDGDGFDPTEKVACIFLVSAPVGGYVVGALMVASGAVETVEGGKFNLLTRDLVVGRKIVSAQGKAVDSELLNSAVSELEVKYAAEHSVVTFFDKESNE